jgi:hypothetical protein
LDSIPSSQSKQVQDSLAASLANSKVHASFQPIGLLAEAEGIIQLSYFQ